MPIIEQIDEEEEEKEEEEKEEEVGEADHDPVFSSRGEEEWPNEDLPRPFEYDLAQMYPVAGTRKRAILEDRLYLYLVRHNIFLKKYVVLNLHCLFFYESGTHFRHMPDKPQAVVPLEEVDGLEMNEVQSSQILKQRGTQRARLSFLGQRESTFELRIKLRRNYHTFKRLVWNSEYFDI